MWIMIAGPYTATVSDAEREANLQVLNQAALAVLRMGHTPVIGVNMALPVIAAGGGYDEVMMPLSLALAERCDACLRVGGPSAGAEAEMDRFRARGLPIYAGLDEVPRAV